MPFTDVHEADWYYQAVQAAYFYELIKGFNDGTFSPTERITREQAMVIIDKAMELTGLDATLDELNPETVLLSYSDANRVSDWALESAASCIQANLFSGRSDAVLAPGEYITRAEVAVLMQRLLQKSEFI